MVEDPKLREILEEEARIIQKECDELAKQENLESFKRKLKLQNRYDEIQRILAADRSYEVIAKAQRRQRRYLGLLAATVLLVCVLLGAVALSQYRRLDVLDALLEEQKGRVSSEFENAHGDRDELRALIDELRARLGMRD